MSADRVAYCGEALDELVVSDCSVHVELMGSRVYWIGITKPGVCIALRVRMVAPLEDFTVHSEFAIQHNEALKIEGSATPHLPECACTDFPDSCDAPGRGPEGCSDCMCSRLERHAAEWSDLIAQEAYAEGYRNAGANWLNIAPYGPEPAVGSSVLDIRGGIWTRCQFGDETAWVCMRVAASPSDGDPEPPRKWPISDSPVSVVFTPRTPR